MPCAPVVAAKATGAKVNDAAIASNVEYLRKDFIGLVGWVTGRVA